MWRCLGALKPSGKKALGTTCVYVRQPKLCKSQAVLSPLQLFFTQGSLLTDIRTLGSMPCKMGRGQAHGVTSAKPKSSAVLQETGQCC